MPLPKSNTYTIDDIYALPEGQRAELIDGQIYDMAPPSPMHQELVMELSATLRDYIKKNGGSCKVYPAPFAVFLNEDDRNYVEPDISVICDSSKVDNRGYQGDVYKRQLPHHNLAPYRYGYSNHNHLHHCGDTGMSCIYDGQNYLRT